MPTFMDVFATFSQTEYINVGLKWNVAESKAAMAYATRLSSGHKPIAQQTDDYHIEVFSKADKPALNDFSKLRFRQKGAYSGSLGYAAPDEQGIFQFWDNKKKDFARVQLGNLVVMKNAEITGNLNLTGSFNGSTIVSKLQGNFAGTVVGASSIGSRIEAPEAKGLGLYIKAKGSTVDDKKPSLFVTDAGNVGIGTITPSSQLHIKATANALRVETGTASFGETASIEIDGLVQGKAAAGQRLKVLSNGNVGVNMPAPEEKLHVSGGFKVDSGDKLGPSKASVFVTNTLQKCDEHSIRVRDHFYVSACGKVGVKTPMPLAEFHVTGKSQTDFIDVTKDASIAGTLTTNKLAPLKGPLEAGTLKITKDTQLVGKVQMDSDVVIKGNLYVEKEVRMVGGDSDEESEMSQMLESRVALIEESHKSLQEWHKSLLESHDNLKRHNEKLQARVEQLESQMTTQR